MVFPVTITGTRDDRRARVSPVGLAAVGVAQDRMQAIGQVAVVRKPFCGFLSRAGAIAMNVSATASNPKEFVLLAQHGRIVAVESLVFTFASTQMANTTGEGAILGPAGTLGNGFQFGAVHASETFPVAGSETANITTAGDFIRLGFSRFMVENWIASTVDYAAFTYTFPEPVQLWPDTNDKIYFRIRDDLQHAAMVSFNGFCKGWQERYE